MRVRATVAADATIRTLSDRSAGYGHSAMIPLSNLNFYHRSWSSEQIYRNFRRS
jgi:hypothetical protein